VGAGLARHRGEHKTAQCNATLTSRHEMTIATLHVWHPRLHQPENHDVIVARVVNQTV
jgi:hypothetical protein